MEFIWMIPLYIIIPFTGLILLFNGFYAGRGNGRKRIGLGFLLLSLPLLHTFLVDQSEIKLKKSLIGNYALDSRQIVLHLKADMTFELIKIDSINSFGKGKWQCRRWDVDEVELNFYDSSQLSFVIVNNGKYLQNSFWTGERYKWVMLAQTENKHRQQ